MLRSPSLLVLLALSVTYGCDGCGQDDTGDTASVEVDALTSATPNVDEAVLGSEHPGWLSPSCAGCHDTVHTSGYLDANCATCHGGNGAPLRAVGHDNGGCADCHDQAHADLGAVTADDCRGCHGYADAQGCTHSESRQAIVVGAGGGGLAAAVTLAEAGVDVLVLEQHYKPGGAMVNFVRGDYRFEASLHAYDGWGVQYLTQLGIDDEVEILAGEIMYSLVFPDMTVDVPADADAYRALLQELFPEQSDAIASLFDGWEFRNLGSYGDMSLAEAVASHGVTDERLVDIITILTGFLASDIDQLDAADFIGMWCAYHRIGYDYFTGGSQAITDALEARLLDLGGELRLHSRVQRITVADGQVTGVETADGGCYEAPTVISNASAPATFFELVGEEHLPGDMVAELEARSPAPSLIAMLFLGVAHDYSELFPGGTHELWIETETPATSCSGTEADISIGNYTAIDATASPAGTNSIVITASPMPYDCAWGWESGYADYREYKATLAQQLLAQAEVYLPDLSQHVEVMELGTAVTVEQFTLNPEGSWAGWEIEHGGEFPYTSDHATPVPGLYQAGAWVVGAGQSVVLASGMAAANQALSAMEDQED